MSDKGNRISQVVENRQHIIKHCRGKMFTSESLKIVALICMSSFMRFSICAIYCTLSSARLQRRSNSESFMLWSKL